ncbi:fimbrial assembly protein [Proteus mirabilis]|uniref:Fimbrial assembly protein n=1 Tax=Proteus mirabilis TaxID=584 RepID=A0A379GDR9_PROMI|nr:fimbrial assembly protein [Proteus mirabilis]
MALLEHDTRCYYIQCLRLLRLLFSTTSKTLSLLQSQYQKREYSLQKQYHNDQHEQKVTRLYQQRYWHYYQHWLHYLNYLAFFQALETLLPTEGYIAQFSENDATFSLQVRLPCEQALTFISKVNQHPNLTSLTLSSFQQSKQDPVTAK